MIKIIDGDLLTSNTDIIAHQVNCKGAFNSGVAKAIRDYDVQVYKDYHSFCSINTPEQLLCIRPLSAAIRAAFSGQTGPY